MSLEAFNSSESTSPTNNEVKIEEAKTLLQSIRDFYNKNPYGKQAVLAMGLMASFSAKGVEAVDSNENVALLSSTEFTEHVSELVQHPDIILAAEELQEFQNAEVEKAETADWHGYSLYQEINGADKMVNWEEEYPDFPQSGSGVFAMSSLLRDAMSVNETGDKPDAAVYTGISQHYTLRSEEGMQIVPEGDAYTITVTINEGLDKDGQIIDAIADKLGYTKGTTSFIERPVSDSKAEDEAVGNIGDSIGSRINVPLASWSVNEISDGEEITGYTVTIQPGKIVSPEEGQN